MGEKRAEKGFVKRSARNGHTSSEVPDVCLTQFGKEKKKNGRSKSRERKKEMDVLNKLDENKSIFHLF